MTGVTLPDVEGLLIDLLAANGCSDPISTDVPNPRPAGWLQVQRIGGPIANLVSEAAQVTLSGWADAGDTVAALEQLNAARGVLVALSLGLITHPVLFGAKEYGGPIDLPDPSTTQARYTCNWVIRARF